MYMENEFKLIKWYELLQVFLPFNAAVDCKEIHYNHKQYTSIELNLLGLFIKSGLFVINDLGIRLLSEKRFYVVMEGKVVKERKGGMGRENM